MCSYSIRPERQKYPCAFCIMFLSIDKKLMTIIRVASTIHIAASSRQNANTFLATVMQRRYHERRMHHSCSAAAVMLILWNKLCSLQS